VRRLLAVVPDTVRGRQNRAILLILVLMGRRRAEVIGLRAVDISIEGETVFNSYRGKGGKRGRRELPRPAYDAIAGRWPMSARSWRRWTPRRPLLQAGASAQGITSSTVYSRFRRYLRAAGCQAGLAPTGLHVLRHTEATLRRDAGASVEAVSAFLDHSSLAVTTVYLRRLKGETDRTWPTSRWRSGFWERLLRAIDLTSQGATAQGNRDAPCRAAPPFGPTKRTNPATTGIPMATGARLHELVLLKAAAHEAAGRPTIGELRSEERHSAAPAEPGSAVGRGSSK
jgi:hypothetical protein